MNEEARLHYKDDLLEALKPGATKKSPCSAKQTKKGFGGSKENA